MRQVSGVQMAALVFKVFEGKQANLVHVDRMACKDNVVTPDVGADLVRQALPGYQDNEAKPVSLDSRVSVEQQEQMVNLERVDHPDHREALGLPVLSVRLAKLVNQDFQDSQVNGVWRVLQV